METRIADEGKVIAQSVDADGCLYNRYYALMSHYLILTYRDQMLKFHNKGELSAEELAERNKLIIKIVEDLKKIKINLIFTLKGLEFTVDDVPFSVILQTLLNKYQVDRANLNIIRQQFFL